MWNLLWLLLPIASASGWVMGKKHALKPSSANQKKGLNYEYLVGLNYVINEQPDRAVDVFIKMLDVDGDTVATHLALGSLFRRRGEVDRAIRIHQNIIARPQLEKEQRVLALTELGKDYLKAGVLDRAERVFLELVSLGEELQSSLEYLLNIYQQQKDWQQCIHIAQKIGTLTRVQMNGNIAQYYCEMAETQIEQVSQDQALHFLKRALTIDRQCVRASLLQARIFISKEDYKNVIRSLERVVKQNPDFICEIIEPLNSAYTSLGKSTKYISYLRVLLQEFPRTSIVLALSDYIVKSEGERAGIDFVAEQISRIPSLKGLQRLINLYVDNSAGDAKIKLTMLHNLVGQLLADKPIYLCTQCGFSAHDLYWHCPGCRNWNSIQPIHGIEGD